VKGRLRHALLLLAFWSTLASGQYETEGKNRSSGLAGAPESAHALINPYTGQPAAAMAGRKLFMRHCSECHGADALGGQPGPPLDSDRVQAAPPGDLFWFLTNGNLRRGMPAWSRLPDARRWQIISFLRTLRGPTAGDSAAER
jgi:mono/diheme cytochrome c family protein